MPLFVPGPGLGWAGVWQCSCCRRGAAGVMDVVWEGQHQPWAPWVSPGALLASSPPQHGMQLIAGPQE